jgi:hypothetical protein
MITDRRAVLNAIFKGEHLKYAMSINAQTEKKAFVGTILVPITRCARTVENL